MLDVVLALLPALAAGVWVLGLRALTVTLVCVAAAAATELAVCTLTRRPGSITDGSAAVTGLLLAMTLPHTIPYWQAASGGFLAIALMKAPGLGRNIFNPALAARAMLMLLFPLSLTRFTAPDGVTAATALHHMAQSALPEETIARLFLASPMGSIGELSPLALLLGGGYLIFRRVISPRIPLAYLGTAAVLTLLLPQAGAPWEWMLWQLFSGGLMLGAIFMATDYATSPVTPRGRLLYGLGCGILTVLFRYRGIFPEGVTYAILIMNALAITIDRHTPPRRFGTGKGGSLQ